MTAPLPPAEGVDLTLIDGVARIHFRRPGRLNALDLTMTTGFRAAAEAIAADPTARVVLLSGEGRAFMAGGDLAWLKASEDRAEAARALIGPIHQGLVTLYDTSLPILSAVQGATAGAGMSLALFADLCVAADDVQFNLAYLKVGATPDCGGSWSLRRRVGAGKAMEIALFSETIGAAEALRLWLVNRVVAAPDLETEALAWARRIAAGPPQATRLTRSLIAGATTAELETQLARELEGFVACAATEDFGEALDAFLGKRRPRFSGR